MGKLKSNQMPELLRQIPGCPSFLYFKGDKSLLSKKCITIVGTRNITEYGKWCIEYLLENFLRELDVVVVSGLARGVDSHAHKICLERDILTMAIVPGGINSYIPKSNMGIYLTMQEKGLVLAEFPRNTILKKEMFVLRNRLLAGISGTTIVVEAGLNSGSLITANFALEYNRDVYVIPGNIGNKMSHGCNMLAKQGAGIITSLDDFKEILGIENDQVLLKV